MTTLSFDRLPSTLPIFAQLAVSKAKSDKTLKAPLVAQTRGVVATRRELRRYIEVCGGSEGLGLPILFPQVLGQPLGMKLLAHPDFPLAALGLVHLENEVVQERAPRVGEKLDFKVSIPGIERTPRGYEFELVTEVADDNGELIWEARARILSRAKDPNATSSGPRKPPEVSPSDWPLVEVMKLDAGQGRRYARVSGDWNPIHLSKPSARMLGFKQAIIHGMWSAAAIAAELEVADGPCRYRCEFKTPLFLPGKANLHVRKQAEGQSFLLQDARTFKPILTGQYLPTANQES